MKKFFKALFKIIMVLLGLAILGIVLILIWPGSDQDLNGRVFYDDFSDNKHSWNTNGSMIITNGVFHIGTKSVYLQTQDIKVRDGIIRLRMKWPSLGYAGVIFRCSDERKYRVLFVGSSGQVVLSDWVNGSYRKILRDRLHVKNSSDFHNFEIDFSGDVVKLTVDQIQSAIFTFPGVYVYGAVGLMAERNSAVEIDSMEILDRQKMPATIKGRVLRSGEGAANVGLQVYRSLDNATLTTVFVGATRSDDEGNYGIALPDEGAYFINISESERKDGKTDVGGRYVDFEFEKSPVRLDISIQAKQ